MLSTLSFPSQPRGPRLQEGSLMQESFSFMENVLAGDNYIDHIFGHTNPKGPV